MKIVQIRGMNASGKTTIAKGLIDLSEDPEELQWEGIKKPVTFAIVMEDIGWAVIGRYPEGSKMGGCDLMKTMDDIKAAIEYVVSNYPHYNGVVFEGMMITKSLWTFPTFMKEMNAKYNTESVMVFLNSTLEGCLARLKVRGTSRPGSSGVNQERLRDGCNNSRQYADRIEAAGGVKVYRIDVDRTPKSAMLPKFLKIVDPALWSLVCQP